MKKIETIAIVGLGLMGGSLAARIRKRFPKTRIIGISRNRASIATALKKRWIHDGSTHLEAVQPADLIVLCTPVDTFAKFLIALEKVCKPGTLVTDVGSVKGEIVRWVARKKLKNIRFVGAHPMAGSHARGIQAARENLFDRSLTFVIRAPFVPPQAFQAVKSFWSKITPRIVPVTAEEHDRITSEISHLPHAIAACLAQTPEEKNLRFAASGFADSTRIAGGDASVWLPIFMANRKEVLRSLAVFEAQSAAFRRFLEKADTRSLLKFLDRARVRRESLTG